MQAAQGVRGQQLQSIYNQAQGLPGMMQAFGSSADPIAKYMQWRQMQAMNKQAQDRQVERDQLYGRYMGGQSPQPTGQAYGNWAQPNYSYGFGQGFGGGGQGNSMQGYGAFGSPGPGDPNQNGGAQGPY
jgi:hypothetical protein